MKPPPPRIPPALGYSSADLRLSTPCPIFSAKNHTTNPPLSKKRLFYPNCPKMVHVSFGYAGSRLPKPFHDPLVQGEKLTSDFFVRGIFDQSWNRERSPPGPSFLIQFPSRRSRIDSEVIKFLIRRPPRPPHRRYVFLSQPISYYRVY